LEWHGYGAEEERGGKRHDDEPEWPLQRGRHLAERSLTGAVREFRADNLAQRDAGQMRAEIDDHLAQGIEADHAGRRHDGEDPDIGVAEQDGGGVGHGRAPADAPEFAPSFGIPLRSRKHLRREEHGRHGPEREAQLAIREADGGEGRAEGEEESIADLDDAGRRH
jgi:hypothetical protein